MNRNTMSSATLSSSAASITSSEASSWTQSERSSTSTSTSGSRQGSTTSSSLSASTTTTASSSPLQMQRSQSINIRALLTSHDDHGNNDFFSQAVFDAMEAENVDLEDAFIRAQMAMFDALDDAALARALAESEREADAERYARARAIVPPYSRYALVSPSELGGSRRHTRSHSTSSASSTDSTWSSSTSSSASISDTSAVSTSTLTPASSTYPSPSSSPPRSVVTLKDSSVSASTSTSTSVPVPCRSEPSQFKPQVSETRSSKTHDIPKSKSKVPVIPASAPSPMVVSAPSTIYSSASSSHSRRPTAPIPRAIQSSSAHPIPIVRISASPASSVASSTVLSHTLPTIVSSSSPRPRLAVPAQISRPSVSKGQGTPSARDLANGLMSSSSNSPTTPSAPHVQPPEQGSGGKTNTVGPSTIVETADISDGTRKCSQCSSTLESQTSISTTTVIADSFSHTFLRTLHVACQRCSTSHCRGCFKRVDAGHDDAPRCPKSCRGGKGCDIRNCCPLVSLAAVSECLGVLDAEFCTMAEASAAGGQASASPPRYNMRSSALSKPSGNSALLVEDGRQAFLELVLSRSDRTTKAFEGVLVKTLGAIQKWLEVLKEVLTPVFSDSASTCSSRYAPSLTSKENAGVHQQLESLVMASQLPMILHFFLSIESVSDWIRFGEVYSAILGVLRKVVECGAGGILSEPTVLAARRPSAKAGSRSASSRSEKSIWDLVNRLEEKMQAQLMNYASTIKFDSTREKVNRLCDGIMWLVLQNLMN